ncbi:MAG: phage scaffolding protein [Clostridia bacterium]
MTRQEMEKLLGEGASKEQVDALLNAMHAEIKSHKDAADAAAAELTTKTAELAEAAKAATSAKDLQDKLTALTQKYEADTKAAAQKLDEVAFHGMLESAIRESKGRNAKAITALLDVEKLRQSKNQHEEVLAAVKALAAGEDGYLFGESEPKPTGNRVTVGGKIDKPTGADDDLAQVRSAMGLPAVQTKDA